MENLGLHEVYRDETRHDTPYRRVNDWIVNGLLQMPYVPTRLENCTLVAASYGVDYRCLLWNVRLIQQYLSTPSIEKVGPDGIGRYLHQRAINGTVPHQVAWMPSKDMGCAVSLPTLLDRVLPSLAALALRMRKRSSGRGASCCNATMP